ncbi:tetratricopeptide repeat protein [Porifericola rhodea]|uniref:tetratricopeptide repeat protein n=1 Tax=Porifericola rhodea TaxID=930972 RepID=UPI0026667867|nr:tetratricopeptide repeat protein [Porifericola rhodea]WKN30115.1 tetratricopeptide repeat protein [Porifericola rhodea]
MSAPLPVLTDKSIAVLPFVNMSTEKDNEYFSDGITEEIINALTKVRNLKVTARTSSFAFKNKNLDIREIARTLNVATILEGSVRKAGKQLRITAQLILAENGFHLWSHTFDRQLEDIFVLQDEISLLIVEQIRQNFGHLELQERLVEAPTHHLKAYNFYLKARYHQLKWNSKDLERAAKLYHKCVLLDETYALAYFGLVQVYGILASWNFMSREEGFQKAQYYLQKGLALNDSSAEAHYSLATAHFWGFWRFEDGYKQLQKVLSLKPSSDEAHEGLAELYTALGDFERAMHHAEAALQLNPLSPNHWFTKGNIYYHSGRFPEAYTTMDKVLDLDTNWSLALQLKALCYTLLKDKAQLLSLLQTKANMLNAPHHLHLYELMHEDKANEFNDLQETNTYLPMKLYFQLYGGSEKEALKTLKLGISNREGQYINFKSDPLLKKLHRLPEFQALVSQTFASTQLIVHKKGCRQQDTPKMSADEVQRYIAALERLLKDEKPYLDATLTLKALAERIQLHPNKLSWLLNEHLHQNFNELINSYRLQAFKAKAVDSANAHLTLLGMAYESGFNSKTVFNAYFKKICGLTPKAWLKQEIEGSTPKQDL